MANVASFFNLLNEGNKLSLGGLNHVVLSAHVKVQVEQKMDMFAVPLEGYGILYRVYLKLNITLEPHTAQSMNCVISKKCLKNTADN